MKSVDSQKALDIASIRLNSLRATRHKTHRLSCTEPNALCRVCGRQDSCKAYNPQSNVTSCDAYIPIFPFVDGQNLDAEEVNTIRLGAAWRDRLDIGDTIALYNKTDNTMCYAQVTNISWDYNKSRLLAWSAKYNHLGMTYENPAPDLKKTLIRLYGKNFYNNAKGLTAIYFRLI